MVRDLPLLLIAAGILSLAPVAHATAPISILPGETPKAGESLDDLLQRGGFLPMPSPAPANLPAADEPLTSATPGGGGFLVDWTPLMPTPRDGFLAAFDPPRGRLVIASGGSEQGFLDDSHEMDADGRWSRIARKGWDQPRSSSALVFDPVQDRMLAFGGFQQHVLDGAPGYYCLSRSDTYELRPGGEWCRIPVTGVSPPPRYDHAAVVDPVRNQLVVFGGVSLPPLAVYCWSTVALADVWVLPLADPASWSQLQPGGTPPPAGIKGSAMFDAEEDRLIFVSGSSAWELRFSPSPTWRSLDVTGPGPTHPASAVFDAQRRQIISRDRENTWSFELSGGTPSWTRLSSAGSPPLSDQFRATWDATHARLLVIDGRPTMRVWQLDLSGTPVWSRADRSLAPALTGHRTVYDALRHRMIAVGGLENADVLAFDLARAGTWQVLKPGAATASEPGARTRHVLLHDALRDRLIVFGGSRPNLPVEPTMWSLDLDADGDWVAHDAPQGSPPLSSRAHGIIDGKRDRAVVILGNDAWELSLSDLTWRRLQTTGSGPGFRTLATVIHDPLRNRMVLHGGLTTGGSQADLWSLDLESLAWAQIIPGNGSAEAALTPHLIHDPLRDRYVLATGLPSTAAFEFFPAWLAWSYLDQHCCGWNTLTPPERVFHSAIHDPVADALIVSGGRADDGSSRLDVWMLPFGNPGHWARVVALKAPSSGSVNGRAGGVLQIAVLGAPDFDATQVDPATVRFGGAAVRAPGEGHVRSTDVNGDGHVDLSLDIESRDLDWVEGQKATLFTARTLTGAPVTGAGILATKRPTLPRTLAAPEPNDAGFGLVRCTFNRSSGVRVWFSVPEPGAVTIEVFDVAGRRHALQRSFAGSAGPHTANVPLPATSAAGVYFVRLLHADQTAVRRAVLGAP